MLINRHYLGIKTYRVNGVEKETKGCWDAIIDEITFNRVQKMLKSNHRTLKTKMRNRYPYLLTGFLKCGKCGDKLCGKSANGNSGKIPYYEHAWQTNKQACLNKKIFTCYPKRIQSQKIEEVVWNEIVKLLQGKLAHTIIDKAHKIHSEKENNSDSKRLKKKIKGITGQIDALAEHLSKIPKSVNPEPIFKQMETLEKLKEKHEKELISMELSESYEMPVSLGHYEKFIELVKTKFKDLNDPKMKKKLIERLVYKVEVFEKGLRIHFYVGESVLVTKKRGAGEDSSFYFCLGSKTLTNGGSGEIRTRGTQNVRTLSKGLVSATHPRFQAEYQTKF